ncbi:hypothetical protein BJY00DRAFT_287252 [Aspergillus carlsbadensis]|nr:hypothetical protein BJY00DRAFT_287252 [Aspergillus carlsbadensis]
MRSTPAVGGDLLSSALRRWNMHPCTSQKTSSLRIQMRAALTFGISDWTTRIREFTTSVNTTLEYGLPYQGLSARWPGVTVIYFDAHTLLSEIVAAPGQYLQEPVREMYEMFRGRCTDFTLTDCEFNEGPLAGYIRYDELHPSEKVEEIIVDEFIKMLAGTSHYGTSYHI